MIRLFSLIILTGLTLASCDIRKKDQKFRFPDQEEAVKDTHPPTTVQILDTVLNFGQVNEGELVERSYRFKNTGDKPLVISSAKGSCGCTVPEKPEKPVAPGETSVIKVKFDSKGRPGQAQKVITVVSNALPPFPPLLLEGEVIGKPNDEENTDKQ